MSVEDAMNGLREDEREPAISWGWFVVCVLILGLQYVL